MRASMKDKPSGTRTTQRRAPEPPERIRDADRSRQRLLAAALDEFAEKGFAGARVQDIAERAGLNKQLINYYFGGKEGLYRALQQGWLEREATLADPAIPLPELMVRYLQDSLTDPRPMRLMIWRGLSDPAQPPPDVSPERQDMSGMERRQLLGELSPDLDPRCVLLALMGMVAAPAALPHVVRKLFGVNASSAEFQDRYPEQVGRLVAKLGAPTPGRPSQKRKKP